MQLWNSCCNNKQFNESSKKKSIGRRKVGVRFVATCRRWNSHYSPKGSPSPEPLTTSSPHPYDSIVDPWLLTLTSLRTPTFVTWSSTSRNLLPANVRVEIVGVLLVLKVFLLEMWILSPTDSIKVTTIKHLNKFNWKPKKIYGFAKHYSKEAVIYIKRV